VITFLALGALVIAFIIFIFLIALFSAATDKKHRKMSSDAIYIRDIHDAEPEGFHRQRKEVPVAGVSRRQEEVIRFINGTGHELSLIREPSNPADPNAIKVVARWSEDAHQQSAHIGYVPAEIAAKIQAK